MELWDIVDFNRKHTGRTIERGQDLGPGEFHTVIHVCIFNAESKLLIQQRQPFKKGWPNCWDLTTGGSALAGETSQEAAMREVQEEIGYRIQLDGVAPNFTVHFARGFDDYYLLEAEVDLARLQLQEEEVQAVAWATKEEILELLRADAFVTYTEGFIHHLFDFHRYGGSVIERSRGSEIEVSN